MAPPTWLPPLNSHHHYSVSEVLSPESPRYERLSSYSVIFIMKTIVSVKFKSEENNDQQRTFEGLRCEQVFNFKCCLVNSLSLFSKRARKNLFPEMFIPFELDKDNLVEKIRNVARSMRQKTHRCYNVLPFRLEIIKEVKIPDRELEAWNSWYDEKILVDPDFEKEYKRAISRPRTYEELSYQTTLAFRATVESCIDGLKTVSLDDSSSNSSCAICFEEFSLGSKAIRLPCSHMFHGDCVVQWLEVSHVRPLCRFELPSV